MSYYFSSIVRIHRMSYTACEPGYLSLKGGTMPEVHFTQQLESLKGPIQFTLLNDAVFHIAMNRSPMISLRGLLSDLMEIPFDEITNVEILNPIMQGPVRRIACPNRSWSPQRECQCCRALPRSLRNRGSGKEEGSCV